MAAVIAGGVVLVEVDLAELGVAELGDPPH